MIALTIAGFDPSGGAGILADVKTFHSLGVYGTAVITALTAQNVLRVSDVCPVQPDFIEEQLELVLEAEEITYVKTGMLYSPEIVELVASKVKKHNLKVIVDPVMVAGSGGILSENNMKESLKKYLLPQAILATPNIYEAQVLSGIKIENEEDAREAARKLGKFCPVVVTGGHLEGKDIFYNGSIKIIDGEIINSNNTHGSGCTYSAAVTAYLSRGLDIDRSMIHASNFVKESIKNGMKGTLNQFWKNKIDNEKNKINDAKNKIK